MAKATLNIPSGFDPRYPNGIPITVDIPKNMEENDEYIQKVAKQELDNLTPKAPIAQTSLLDPTQQPSPNKSVQSVYPGTTQQNRGFLGSVLDQINPVPSIRDWYNRPAEMGKAGNALTALTTAKQQNRQPTAEENQIINRGMQANIGTPGPSIVGGVQAPILRSTTQAISGDIPGAAGTLIGAGGMAGGLAYLGGPEALDTATPYDTLANKSEGAYAGAKSGWNESPNPNVKPISPADQFFGHLSRYSAAGLAGGTAAHAMGFPSYVGSAIGAAAVPVLRRAYSAIKGGVQGFREGPEATPEPQGYYKPPPEQAPPAAQESQGTGYSSPYNPYREVSPPNRSGFQYGSSAGYKSPVIVDIPPGIQAGTQKRLISGPEDPYPIITPEPHTGFTLPSKRVSRGAFQMPAAAQESIKPVAPESVNITPLAETAGVKPKLVKTKSVKTKPEKPAEQSEAAEETKPQKPRQSNYRKYLATLKK